MSQRTIGLTALLILALLQACSSTPKPRDVKAALKHYNSGVKSLLARRTQAAVKSFKECLKSNPRMLACRWEMGWAYYTEGDWDRTLEQWRIVLAYHPEYPEYKREFPAVRELTKIVAQFEEEKKKAAITYGLTAPTGAIKLKAVGDVMMGTDFPSDVFLPPKPQENLFLHVQETLKDADVTFANLEGPICRGGKTLKCKGKKEENCYVFRTPPRFGKYIKRSGIDLASLANNHAFDFGESCREDTEKLLNRLRIGWSGREDTVTSIKRRGVKIGFVAFHTAAHSNYLNDHEKAKQLVEDLAKKNQIVVVSFHGGAEGLPAIRVPNGPEKFYSENRGDLRKFARLVIDAGADIVLGHGPHVIRGMEIYKDRLIAYSLGNFLTYARFNLSSYKSLGFILEADLDRNGKFLGGKVIPTQQKGLGVPELAPDSVTLDLLRVLSKIDFKESAVLVAQDGTLRAGPVDQKQ